MRKILHKKMELRVRYGLLDQPRHSQFSKQIPPLSKSFDVTGWLCSPGKKEEMI
jgi:hypothetical protein